jgi:hypothetical protein
MAENMQESLKNIQSQMSLQNILKQFNNPQLSSNYQSPVSPTANYQGPSSPITYYQPSTPIINYQSSSPETNNQPIPFQQITNNPSLIGSLIDPQPLLPTIYSQPIESVINPQTSFQQITPDNQYEMTIKYNEIVNNPNFQNQFESQQEYIQACDSVALILSNHNCQQIPVNLSYSLNEHVSNSWDATPLCPVDENHYSDKNPEKVDNSFQFLDYHDNRFKNYKNPDEPLTVESLARKISEELTRIEGTQKNEQDMIKEKLRMQNEKIAVQTQEIRDLKRKLEEMEKTNKPKKAKGNTPFISPINLRNIPTVVSPPNLKHLPNQLPNLKAGQGVIKFDTNNIIQETGKKITYTKEKENQKNILEKHTHPEIKRKTNKSQSPTKRQKKTK